MCRWCPDSRDSALRQPKERLVILTGRAHQSLLVQTRGEPKVRGTVARCARDVNAKSASVACECVVGGPAAVLRCNVDTCCLTRTHSSVDMYLHGATCAGRIADSPTMASNCDAYGTCTSSLRIHRAHQRSCRFASHDCADGAQTPGTLHSDSSRRLDHFAQASHSVPCHIAKRSPA